MKVMKIELEKEKKYLLACSYGPDSMALFTMLLEGNFNFEVAHVNYNLRQESKEETEGLIYFCKAHKINIHIYENKEKITKNLEEKCREIRYNFFNKIYFENRFDCLLVAHNQDDNIETYLLQKKRKNLVNFYGISCKTSLFSMNVYRPLLDWKKSDLTKYCVDNKIPFAIDSSNLEDKFERNKIRHSLVEKMEDTKRKEMIDEINKENQKLKTYLEIANSFDSHKVEDLKQYDDPIFSYILTNMARKIYPNFELSSRLSKEISKVLDSGSPNVTISFKDNFCFIKEYDSFRFDFKSLEKGYSFKVNFGEKIDNDFVFFDSTFDLEKRNLCENDFPIQIRNALPDDEVQISGYIKKVRRLFIDWKMPLSVRKKWPVILNKFNQIVYIPRYQKSFTTDSSLNFYVKIEH